MFLVRMQGRDPGSMDGRDSGSMQDRDPGSMKDRDPGRQRAFDRLSLSGPFTCSPSAF